MQKSDVIAILSSMGWKQDKYGHFKTPSGLARAKLQAMSVRIERKITLVHEYTGKQSFWSNIASDYYCNLRIQDGRLVVQNKILKVQHENL